MLFFIKRRIESCIRFFFKFFTCICPVNIFEYNVVRITICKDMMEISKKILPVFGKIYFRSEQTSFFQLKRTHKFIFYICKLCICCMDYFRNKRLIARTLYHVSFIIQIYFCQQIGVCIYHPGDCFGQLLLINGRIQFKKKRYIIHRTIRILTAFCKNALLWSGKRINFPLLIGSDFRCQSDITFQFFNCIILMDITCFYRNSKFIRDQNAQFHCTYGRQSGSVKACINSKEIVFHNFCNNCKEFFLHWCFRFF